MRCSTARRLLLLHRPGERTAWQDRRLARHLRVCVACATEARHIRDELEKSTLALRDATMVLADEALLASVLSQLAPRPDLRGASSARHSAQPAFRPSLLPRLVPAAATVLIVLAFLGQSLSVLARYAELGGSGSAVQERVVVELRYALLPRSLRGEAQVSEPNAAPVLSDEHVALTDRDLSRDDAQRVWRLALRSMVPDMEESRIRHLITQYSIIPRLAILTSEEGA